MTLTPAGSGRISVKHQKHCGCYNLQLHHEGDIISLQENSPCNATWFMPQSSRFRCSISMWRLNFRPAPANLPSGFSVFFLTEISEALSKTKFMYSSKPCDFLQSKLPVRKSADLWQRYNAYDNLSLDPKIRLLVKPNLYPCLTLQIPKDQILKGEMVSHTQPSDV